MYLIILIIKAVRMQMNKAFLLFYDVYFKKQI